MESDVDDRERLTAILVKKLGDAPIEALIDRHPDVDWGGLAGQMTATKKELEAELKTVAPDTAREAELRHLLGLPPRPHGPGEELKKLTDSLGLKEWEGCSCAAIREEMNRAGVAGSRERRGYFVGRLKENIEQGIANGKIPPDYGSGAKWKAVTTGIAFHLSSWADPIAGLFDLAVDNAEKAAEKNSPGEVE